MQTVDRKRTGRNLVIFAAAVLGLAALAMFAAGYGLHGRRKSAQERDETA